MAEYIERAPLLEDTVHMYDFALGGCECVLVDVIKKAPAADVVEVVRCKDCQHTKLTLSNNIICLKGGALWIVDEKHFCGYGKRRG